MSLAMFDVVVLGMALPLVVGFATMNTRGIIGNAHYFSGRREATTLIEDVKVGNLLSDIPTPCLIMELSLAENTAEGVDMDEILSSMVGDSSTVSLDGCLFVHTRVTDTTERDEITREKGSGKSSIICNVDVPPEWIPGGAYLGIGLANHHVGGYYWARGMGMGASLPAHGVNFGLSDDMKVGRLFWKKRGPGMDAMETTEESSNSNDGKRSEWADFLSVGDTVQLIPYQTSEVLCSSKFDTILGMRRIGRPLGADPIVERIWQRSRDSRLSWIRQ